MNKKEYNKQYYIDNKEKYQNYYQEHKDYYTDYGKTYRAEQREKRLLAQKNWRENNKEKQKEYYKNLVSTPLGRAKYLVLEYRRSDKKYNRGECTLTAEWIADNILSKPCHYCNETDWAKIGCDRIDNSKPHTPDNVVPCCYHCNCKKHTKLYNVFLKEMKN